MVFVFEPTFLKMWVITGAFSSIIVLTNSYPGINPCPASFSLPVLTDCFNTFPSSSIQRTSIISSGNAIESANTPFSKIVTLAGVVTLGTSTADLSGSVILLVPESLPSGRSLFGTLPLPSSPGISTLVPDGYVKSSGFFGVTVTSPVLGDCSNSIFVSLLVPYVRTVVGVTLPVFRSTS